MKRHQSFILLSREHHDGLLLATRLQQGRKALLRLWSHDPKWQAEYVVKFFDDNLAMHFQTEEEAIFSLAESAIPESHTVVRELIDEHTEMRKLVDELRQPDEKKLECTLTRFGQVLEHHIRTEERVFFPMCEEHLPEEILKKIGEIIGEHHKGPSA